MPTLSIAQMFDSWRDFQEILKSYELERGVRFSNVSSRSVDHANRYVPSGQLLHSKKVKYAYVKLGCKEKSLHGNECQAFILLRSNSRLDKLVVKELNEVHDHETAGRDLEDKTIPRVAIKKEVEDYDEADDYDEFSPLHLSSDEGCQADPKAVRRKISHNIYSRKYDRKEEDGGDEFDVFGKSVAFQLRRLSLGRALRVQARIQTMLTEERILDFETPRHLMAVKEERYIGETLSPLTSTRKSIRRQSIGKKRPRETKYECGLCSKKFRSQKGERMCYDSHFKRVLDGSSSDSSDSLGDLADEIPSPSPHRGGSPTPPKSQAPEAEGSRVPTQEKRDEAEVQEPADGAEVQESSDGSEVQEPPDGAEVQEPPDGVEVQEPPDGAEVRTQDKGSEENSKEVDVAPKTSQSGSTDPAPKMSTVLVVPPSLKRKFPGMSLKVMPPKQIRSQALEEDDDDEDFQPKIVEVSGGGASGDEASTTLRRHHWSYAEGMKLIELVKANYPRGTEEKSPRRREVWKEIHQEMKKIIPGITMKEVILKWKKMKKMFLVMTEENATPGSGTRRRMASSKPPHYIKLMESFLSNKKVRGGKEGTLGSSSSGIHPLQDSSHRLCPTRTPVNRKKTSSREKVVVTSDESGNLLYELTQDMDCEVADDHDPDQGDQPSSPEEVHDGGNGGGGFQFHPLFSSSTSHPPPPPESQEEESPSPRKGTIAAHGGKRNIFLWSEDRISKLIELVRVNYNDLTFGNAIQKKGAWLKITSGMKKVFPSINDHTIHIKWKNIQASIVKYENHKRGLAKDRVWKPSQYDSLAFLHNAVKKLNPEDVITLSKLKAASLRHFQDQLTREEARRDGSFTKYHHLLDRELRPKIDNQIKSNLDMPQKQQQTWRQGSAGATGSSCLDDRDYFVHPNMEHKDECIEMLREKHELDKRLKLAQLRLLEKKMEHD